MEQKKRRFQPGTLGQMEQRHLGRSIQPHRRECGAYPATDIQMRCIDSVKPHGIGSPQVGQADISPWQAQFYLPPMIMARQDQRNSVRSGLGENLRPMRKQNCWNGGRKATDGSLQVRLSGAKIIDAGDGKGALFGLYDPMTID